MTEAHYTYAIIRPCARCGTDFLPTHSRAQYCSRACGSEARREAAKRPRRKWGKAERECDHCGKTFETFRSQLDRGRRFCSRECFFASEPLSPALRPGAADKIAAAKTMHGKSTGRRQRQLEHAGCTLAAKGEDRCRNCGSTEYLNLHHAIPRSMWKAGVTEPLNCIPLCVRCHLGWHHSKVTISRTVFRPDEWECISNAPLLGQEITTWLDKRYPGPVPERSAA